MSAPHPPPALTRCGLPLAEAVTGVAVGMTLLEPPVPPKAHGATRLLGIGRPGRLKLLGDGIKACLERSGDTAV